MEDILESSVVKEVEDRLHVLKQKVVSAILTKKSAEHDQKIADYANDITEHTKKIDDDKRNQSLKSSSRGLFRN